MPSSEPVDSFSAYELDDYCDAISDYKSYQGK